MHHGGGDKLELVAAQCQHIAFLDSQCVLGIGVIEGQHLERRSAGYHGDVRVLIQHGLHAGGVVGFYVVHHQIVRLPAVQCGLQIGKELALLAVIHRVHHSDLFIQNDIGIVGDAVGDRVLPLKEVNVPVVDADITDILCNHSCSLLKRAVLNRTALGGLMWLFCSVTL